MGRIIHRGWINQDSGGIGWDGKPLEASLRSGESEGRSREEGKAVKPFTLSDKSDIIPTISPIPEGRYLDALVSFELNLRDPDDRQKKMAVILGINFGEVEAPFESDSEGTQGRVVFGIKKGDLRLELRNSTMPIGQKETTEQLKLPDGWRVEPAGDNKTPIWQFESISSPKILKGVLKDTTLGKINWLATCRDIEIEASFMPFTRSNGLEIISQDGLYGNDEDLKIILIKKTIFFKYIEKILEQYLNLRRVVVTYDDTI